MSDWKPETLAVLKLGGWHEFPCKVVPPIKGPPPSFDVKITLPGVIEMVLVAGEYRAVGVVDQAELEQLELQHDAGDIRAEDKLRLIRTGRR